MCIRDRSCSAVVDKTATLKAATVGNVVGSKQSKDLKKEKTISNSEKSTESQKQKFQSSKFGVSKGAFGSNKSPEKGKSKGNSMKETECKYFNRENGCRFGQSCSFLHPKLSRNDNRCYICGSVEHWANSCPSSKATTNPTKTYSKTGQGQKGSAVPSWEKGKGKGKSKQGVKSASKVNLEEPKSGVDASLTTKDHLKMVSAVVGETLKSLLGDDQPSSSKMNAGKPKGENQINAIEDFLQSFNEDVDPIMLSFKDSLEGSKDEEVSQMKLTVPVSPQTEIKKLILLDGGATHDVRVSAKTPEGAKEVPLDLAYGQASGYVQGGEVTIVDPTTTLEEEEHPRLISLGRLIEDLNLVLKWSVDGATLYLPDGEAMELTINNFCPYGTLTTVSYTHLTLPTKA